MRKGIKKNTKYEILEENIHDLEQLLLGSMLGDGYLTKISGGAKNSRLSYGHCPKQLDYLKYKLSILDKFNLKANTITENKRISDRYKEGFCLSYHAKSKSHPIFTKYRELFYKDNKKILSKEVENLDELGLAIWFMDDASLATRSYQIYTSGFTKDECLYLINFLKRRFDIDATFQPSDNVIYIRTSSIQKFNSLIEPYMIDSMKYKIRRVLNKQDELLENPITVSEDNQQPSLSSNTFEGSTTNSQILNKDSNADTSVLPIEMSLIDIMRPLQLYNNNKFFGDDIV